MDAVTDSTPDIELDCSEGRARQVLPLAEYHNRVVVPVPLSICVCVCVCACVCVWCVCMCTWVHVNSVGKYSAFVSIRQKISKSQECSRLCIHVTTLYSYLRIFWRQPDWNLTVARKSYPLDTCKKYHENKNSKDSKILSWLLCQSALCTNDDPLVTLYYLKSI